MINDTTKLREGSRIIAWDGDYKRYFAIAVTKVGANTCQGIDGTNFEKHTGLKYKHCWWPEDFKDQKPSEYERLFPPKVSPANSAIVDSTPSDPQQSPADALQGKNSCTTLSPANQENAAIENGASGTARVAPPATSDSNLCVGKPDRWNPQDFGEVKWKSEPDGQLTIFWEDSPEPPDPDDYPNPGDYERAWKKWLATDIEPTEPIDPRKIWEYYANSTSAQVSAQDLRSPDRNSDLSLPDSVSATNIANQSCGSDTPACQSTTMCDRYLTQKSRLTSSPRRHHANHFRFRANALGQKMSAIVSQQLLKRSQISSQNISPLKTCQDFYPADSNPVAINPTLAFYSASFPPAGTMRNGSLYPAPTLERPGLESGCFWLASPTALSCNGTGRPPGLSKCESQLRNLKMIQAGEVINPECGEIWSGLPRYWTDPADNRSVSEFLAGAEQTAIAEKPSVMPSIQEWPSAPLSESSISNQSQKKPASGWLEQRTERRKLADGSSVLYPKVEGVRDRTEPSHWYWQYCYEEQVSKGKFRRRNLRISHAKVHAITTAIKLNWPVEKILQYLNGELANP